MNQLEAQITKHESSAAKLDSARAQSKRSRRGRPRRAFGGAFLGVSVVLSSGAACSNLIGLSDYSEIEAAAAGRGGASAGGTSAGGARGGGTAEAGQGGDTGGAGETGSGGATGEGGTAQGGESGAVNGRGGGDTIGQGGDAGGSGGNDSTSGGMPGGGAGGDASGGAADGGSPPAGKGCDGSEFQVNPQVLRGCILNVSCNSADPGWWNISHCVSYNKPLALPGEGCSLDAQNCRDIGQCLGQAVADDTLCTDASGWRCAGDLATNCFGAGSGYYLDCPAYGGTCLEFTDSAGDPTADCLVVPSCPATEEDDLNRCSADGFVYTCVAGQGFGYKCSNFSASCMDDSEDGASCFYNLNACTTEGVTCSSGRGTNCSEGTRYQYDCGSVGLACSASDDVYCLAPGCTRGDELDCTETCDGSQITLCYGGAPYTIDCRDYGFTSCVSGADADTPFTRCVY
jgi:hypothetical protein